VPQECLELGAVDSKGEKLDSLERPEHRQTIRSRNASSSQHYAPQHLSGVIHRLLKGGSIRAPKLILHARIQTKSLKLVSYIKAVSMRSIN